MPLTSNHTLEVEKSNRRVGICLIPAEEKESTKTKELTELDITPNPGDEFLDIKINALEDNAYQLKFYDMAGTLIDTKNDVQSEVKINTSDWKSGMYICYVLQNDLLLYQKRFLVVH